MLTTKQHELLVFIDKHLRQTGCSPSFEEMKEALDLRSKSGIHRLITALEERGFLSATSTGRGRWKWCGSPTTSTRRHGKSRNSRRPSSTAISPASCPACVPPRRRGR